MTDNDDHSLSASVDGTWDITIKSPTGPVSTVLFIERSGEVFSGTQSGRGDTSPITDVKYDGTKLSWINQVTKPMKMKVEFAAVVDGNSMSGKVKTGFMGTYPFSGVKQ